MENGDSLLDLFKNPTIKKIEEGGIHLTFPMKSYKEPTRSKREDWRPAFHGTDFNYLYAILYNEEMKASCDGSIGERYFYGCPAVYCHDGEKGIKRIAAYTRFIRLMPEGFSSDTFWGCAIELMVDRYQGMKRPDHAKTDQWIQPVRSVMIKAVHVIGYNPKDIYGGTLVIPEWNSLLEANPVDYKGYLLAAKKSEKEALASNRRWMGVKPAADDSSEEVV